MDSVQSFRGYDKVDELEQAHFRKKTRKRIVIVSLSLLLFAGLVVGIVAGTIAHNKKNKSGDSPSNQNSAAIRSVCSFTQYSDTCLATLGSSNSSNPEKIFELSLTVLLNSLQRISAFPGEFANRTNDPLVKEALAVCGDVLNDAVESLNDTVSASQDKNSNVAARVDDLRTWLSTVLTDQDTCADALADSGADFAGEVALLMKNSTELASNSLAIVSRVLGAIGNFKLPGNRRLLGSDVPAWVDRRALQAAARPDVTVSASGGGDVRTIKEAVAKIPKKSLRRFVIYVKAGVYVENIVLEKSLWNVMMYGDGKDRTVISGRKNFVDGTPTFSTATFAVVGKGFIARDIGFRNTAGAAKHQAVALRSGSDQSVFYRCSFDAFQDTLYAHSNRQFYRDCDITGTIDFIFGNSAVVFQNCKILPRQPLANQFVTITAQGKKDPNQNTGISIQRCTMSPLDRLTAATYLGRPWKDFSTTVIMETNIGSFLNSKGWISWVTNMDPPKTIVYGEYGNSGPGATTAGRVKWAGYKPSLTVAEAAKYTVGSFIMGQSWLPATTVKFDLK